VLLQETWARSDCLGCRETAFPGTGERAARTRVRDSLEVECRRLSQGVQLRVGSAYLKTIPVREATTIASANI